MSHNLADDIARALIFMIVFLLGGLFFRSTSEDHQQWCVEHYKLEEPK